MGVGLAALLLAFVARPASATDWNVLVGWGVVGPAQYDQGLYKPMMTVNATGILRASDSLCFGGVGVAIRATFGPDRLLERGSFDEFGLAIPFATYQRGHFAAQLGVEIQRANLRKNFYYAALGYGFSGRRRPGKPAARARVVAAD